MTTLSMEGAAADTKQLAVIDLWYRSGGGRLRPSAAGQRCLVQMSAQPLGGTADVPMRSGEIVLLRSFDSLASAEFAKALLEAEGIQAVVEPTDPVVGSIAGVSSGVSLLVDATDRVQRGILEDTELSDAEVDYLATGRLPGGRTRESSS